MNLTSIERDLSQVGEEWKKLAAQSAMDQEDTEKAFSDQASVALQNKAAPIMKSPYRVGFEIVEKNDDNTRMVGIFIFRVAKEFYYAPVFFLNGQIKGTDLFYRASSKRFVPMTNDWVEYLVSVNQDPEGTGIPTSERAHTRNQLNLRAIVEPPMLRKYASEAWAGMQEVADISGESVLKRFLEKDGGPSAMAKLAAAAEQSPDFAEAIAVAASPDIFKIEFEAEKSAAAPEHDLVLHTGLLHNPNVKSASEDHIRKGYMIEDFRKEAALDVVTVSPESSLSSIAEPGIYEVLMDDGGHKTLLCAYESELPGFFKNACGGCNSLTKRDWSARDSMRRSMILVDTTSKHSKRIYAPFKIYGEQKSEITAETGQALPDSGKAYRVLNLKDRTLSDPFVVKSATTENGLTKLELVRRDKSDTPARALVNPDYDGYDTDEGIFGKHCRFVEVAHKGENWIDYEDDIKIGDVDNLNDFVFDNGYKKASLSRQGDFYKLVIDNHRYPEMSKLATVVRLMMDGCMRENDADALLADLDQEGRAQIRFFCKNAYNLRMNDWPQFEPGMDADFGLPADQPHQETRYIDYERPHQEPHRIGDAYKGEETGDTVDKILETAKPMELYQLAKERGTNTLFEHGVVGELVKTYDSMAMLDSYMPDMERALDAVGRTLFLFYWKPEDFVQAFGSDDQNQLENKLISNFKAFGDLVLELLQKTKASQQGTPSLST